jgi:hypothetical protein
MNHWTWLVSLVGGLSTAVLFGTDMFFLTIGRSALILASPFAGTEVMVFFTCSPTRGCPTPRAASVRAAHRGPSRPSLTDVDRHALAVDVFHLDPRRFGPTCSIDVKRHQEHAVQAVG